MFFFIKEADTFGHIVVWTIYISHEEHFTPQLTAFEQSATCLSVVLVTLWFYTVCNIVKRWVNFRFFLHEYELQLSDYNI